MAKKKNSSNNITSPSQGPPAPLQFSLNGPGELRDYEPNSTIPMAPPVVGQAFGQEYTPTVGSFSPAPVIQQTPEEQAAAQEAARNYDINTLGLDAVLEQDARRSALSRQQAQDKAYTTAYQQGEIPELQARLAGTGSFLLLKDDQGRVVGAWNPKTREFRPTGSDNVPAGLRTGAVSEEQRQGVASRLNTTSKLQRLGELANKHPESIGPYVSRYIKAQQSGLIPEGLIDPLDPEVSEMHTLAADLQNARIYEQSGKQINEAEFQRLKTVMPRLDQNPTQFKVAYANFVRELAQKRYSLGEAQLPNISDPATPKKRIKL